MDNSYLAAAPRLNALASVMALRAEVQGTFDRLAVVAARALRAPVAQVNFVFAHLQLSVTSVGPPGWEGARQCEIEGSFCKFVVRDRRALVIDDAQADPLVRDNPSTTDGVRAYVGVPLTAGDDLVLGALCVVDFEPRSWSEEDKLLLEELGRFAAIEIQRRLAAVDDIISLASLVASSPQPIFSMALDGTIRDWNGGARALLSYEPREVIGKHISLLVPGGARGFADRVVARVAAGEPFRREVRLQRADGTRVWAAVGLSPIYDGAGRVSGISAVGDDTTARRRAQRELERSEHRFRTAVEGMMDAFGLYHAVRDTGGRIVDFEVAYVNPAACTANGMRREEQVGRRLLELLPAHARSGLFDQYRKVVDRGESLRLKEFSFDDPDSPTKVAGLFDIAAVRLGNGFAASWRDVSEEGRRKRALLQSESLFRATFDQVAVGMAHIGADGTILRLNHRLAELVGLAAHVLLGLRFADLVGEEDRQAVSEELAALASGEVSILRREVRAADGGAGPAGWLLLTASRVREPDASAAYTVLVVEDLSDMREAQEALRTADEQLRQAQKMEAVGRLAGGVAHDFNNLLAVIKSNTQLMLLDMPPESDQAGLLREVEEGAARAAELTSQLLTFSRQKLVEPRRIDAADTAAGTRSLLDRLLGSDIPLEWDMEGGCTLLMDPGELSQLILNLVVNARDAMPNGGTIRLRGRRASVPSQERGPLNLAAGDWLLITVADMGHGIPLEVQSRMFDPFFTTKEQGKGTGLGLSTVYGIVTRCGGAIGVESEIGRGTTFTVALPLLQGASSPRATAAPTLELPRGTETILLVEDNSAVRASAKRILRRCGYHVVAAASGVEALDTVRGYPGVIHLMVTDVIMPGMNGLELAERLKGIRPETRVLVMSGHTEDTISGETPAAYIQKPFGPRELAAAVRGVLDEPT